MTAGKRKKRAKRGFSLAETLVAMLILLMVSAVVAAGIPAAKNAYEKVTLASNAEVLLSTAASALRDELGTASDITITDTAIRYRSSRTGSYSEISLDENGVIMLREYIGLTDESGSDPDESTSENGSGISRQLVSSEASTKELYVTYQGIEKSETDDGLVIVKGLTVHRKTGTLKTESMDLKIRTAERSY